MAIDFQPTQASSPAPAGSSSAPTSGAIDFQPLAKEPSTLDTVASKALAATGGATQGILKGIGQTAEAIPNLASAAIEKGLNFLNQEGMVPDSISSGFSAGRNAVKGALENAGNKILQFQGQPSAADRLANPNTTGIANVLGNIAASTVGAAGIVGKAGMLGEIAPGVNPILNKGLNIGAQGLIQGAGANSEHPIAGGLTGAFLGSIGGAVAGKFDRSAQIINDKIEDAHRVGMSPFSEAGIKSIQGAMKSDGMELTNEETQRITNQVIQSKLDAIAPKIDIKSSPMDAIVNAAKARFPEVEAAKNANYAPLNASTAATDTTNLSQTIQNTTGKVASKILPDLPGNATISNLMTYRKQVGAAIDQVTRTLQKGSIKATYDDLQQLNAVKTAATADLNAAAEKAGLGGQLAKADAFHKDEYLPFKVYNTDAGKLASPSDTNMALTRAAQLLKSKRPNYDAMADVAKTLGPQGKDLFGSAYLQQVVNRSQIIDGRVDPNKLFSEFKMMKNSGLAQHILTPELNEAFNGMHEVAEGAIKTIKGAGGESKNAIIGAVNAVVGALPQTSGGIQILRALGSKTTPTAKIKNAVAQLLNTAIEKGTAQAIPPSEP